MARFMKLLGPYLDEAGDGTQGGSAGGATQSGADPEAGAQAGTQTPTDIAAGMLAAIEGGTIGGDDATATQGGEAGVGARVPGVQQPAAGAGGAAADPAAGSKLLDANGKPIDPNAQQEPSKKKADDFTLTDEEKKGLNQRSISRFHELHKLTKEREADVERLTTENAALSQARENIMSVLTESKVEPDDFVQLMDFNRRVKTGDLEGALAMVEDYRVQLLQVLGKDAPGYDPLALDQHADLKARVDELSLSREDALKLVRARRIEEAHQQQTQRHQQGQQQQVQVQQSQQAALAEVARWEQTLKADVDYAKKQDTLASELPAIVRDYPPHLWVPTLERLYRSISVAPQQQAPQQRPSTPSPLRPSGAKGGNPVASSYLEAIDNGLGYTN